MKKIVTYSNTEFDGINSWEVIATERPQVSCDRCGEDIELKLKGFYETNDLHLKFSVTGNMEQVTAANMFRALADHLDSKPVLLVSEAQPKPYAEAEELKDFKAFAPWFRKQKEHTDPYCPETLRAFNLYKRQRNQ